MSSPTPPSKSAARMAKAAHVADELDVRYRLAPGLRRQINKVFPTHWSFLLGEIALYSFILLVISGIYLTFFFDPSMQVVQYQGEYPNLRGVEMSRAYESTIQISFAVRGGLFVRQIHHWAALIFTAAIMAHMFRIFFTGAFRKPREANWTIGVALLLTSMIEGFIGYSLPDDLLSGTGLRTGLSGILLSIPVIGTWLHWMVLGGEFPGDIIIPRFYIAHVLLLPGIIIALIAVHLALVWYQKHTQFPGPGRTENNVVGIRILPTFAAKSAGLTAIVVGVTALMGGIFQINPIWNYGPYVPAHDSAGSQPDWYMAIFDGALRVWPSWQIWLFHRWTIPAVFFPAIVGIGLMFTLLWAYPAIEKRFTGDEALHNLLQRPRDVPVRTSLGVMAIVFYTWLLVACGNDIIAHVFDFSLNGILWANRIGLLVLPPIAYWVTYRICLGLQRSDRAVLEHGVETGIIRRLPHGEFIEVHQPLGGVDAHGHPVPLPYQGAPVPKRMNELGLAGHPVSGSLLRPDPVEETRALERASHSEGTSSPHRELAGHPDAGRPKDVAD